MSFKELDVEELYRAAVEDFACDVNPEDKNRKEIILAALVEDGVTWQMYLEAHPELAPVEEEKPKRGRKPANAGKEGKLMSVRTASPAVDESTEDMYLVKMERDNPYYEYKKYKFTTEHPYVPMTAEDASRLVRDEEGFSIATPMEAQEYYERR